MSNKIIFEVIQSKLCDNLNINPSKNEDHSENFNSIQENIENIENIVYLETETPLKTESTSNNQIQGIQDHNRYQKAKVLLIMQLIKLEILKWRILNLALFKIPKKKKIISYKVLNPSK